MLSVFLVALAAMPSRDTLPVDSVPVAIASDTVPRRRPKAIQYSDAYSTRLTIHRVGSYTMLPMFAAEYALGQNLMNGNPPSWVKPTHLGVALGIGTLFVINTTTGVWNVWEGRQDPAGRTRRIVHSALMIAADAGFVAAGAMGDDANSPDARRRHRNVALGSIAVSTVGSAMMWFWKD